MASSVAKNLQHGNSFIHLWIGLMRFGFRIGVLFLIALFQVESGSAQTLFGRSQPTVPVTNGITDVGVVDLLEDGDRDGMDDAYERANGLNPNDPTDGPLDPDGDGLTNLVESRLLTLAQVAVEWQQASRK